MEPSWENDRQIPDVPPDARSPKEWKKGKKSPKMMTDYKNRLYWPHRFLLVSRPLSSVSTFCEEKKKLVETIQLVLNISLNGHIFVLGWESSQPLRLIEVERIVSPNNFFLALEGSERKQQSNDTTNGKYDPIETNQ